MKKWIAILAVLLVVVCASGCTTQPKTYSGNGITFQYPGDWGENWTSSVQQSFGSSGSILVSLGSGDSGVAIAKVNMGSLAISLSDFAAAFKTGMTGSNMTFVSEKNRTIDGVTGYELVVKDNSANMYGSFTLLQKNGNLYLIMIATKDNNQETIDMILNSFKVQ